MRVRVRLFAGTRDAVGRPQLDVEVAEGARISDVMHILYAAHPRLAAYRGHALLALDGTFVPDSAALHPGAQLAIMPPVSGGATEPALQEGPFSIDSLVASVDRTGAGAVVAFVGCVRGDEHVTHLRFEAYEEMAEKELELIRTTAAEKFSLTGCRIVHRVARLAVGEPIVAVVAAAAHRREAFEAATWIMDEIKARVPIWKSEERPAGAHWVNDPTR